MLQDQLYPAHLCWYFRKHSPWKHKMDQGLARVVEAGLVRHWMQVRHERNLVSRMSGSPHRGMTLDTFLL